MVDFRNMFTIHRDLLSFSPSLSLYELTLLIIIFFFFPHLSHLFFLVLFSFLLDTAETIVIFLEVIPEARRRCGPRRKQNLSHTVEIYNMMKRCFKKFTDRCFVMFHSFDFLEKRENMFTKLT